MYCLQSIRFRLVLDREYDKEVRKTALRKAKLAALELEARKRPTCRACVLYANATNEPIRIQRMVSVCIKCGMLVCFDHRDTIAGCYGCNPEAGRASAGSAARRARAQAKRG